jgi:hypothetical protein
MTSCREQDGTVPIPDLHDQLVDLPRDHLVRLLVELAEQDPAVARRLRLQSLDGRTRQLGRVVDETLRTRRRHLGYREMLAYAGEAGPLVDALAQAAEGPAARDAVPVVERALSHVVKVLQHGDDSAGAGGDVARSLLRVHARASDVGRPDRRKLVRWLLRFTLDDQDFFHPDVRDYAAALGEEGVEEYRTEVRRRAESDPEAFAPGHALQQLALHDRDADAIVRLVGGDLDGAHRYVSVAQAFREIGDHDAALLWARRGMAQHVTWHSRKLYDLAADVLAARGDLDGVVEVRRGGLEALPDPTSYAALREAAAATAVWPTLRPDALATLRGRGTDHYLLALLSDGDVDTAWSALQNADVDPLQESTVQRLAAARAETHPADAVPFARRAVEQTLGTADRRAYRQAVKVLLHLRVLHDRSGTVQEFDSYLAAVVEANRRRPSFLDELRKTGLWPQGGAGR